MHQPDPASKPCLRLGRAWPLAQRALAPCRSSRGRVAAGTSAVSPPARPAPHACACPASACSPACLPVARPARPAARPAPYAAPQRPTPVPPALPPRALAPAARIPRAHLSSLRAQPSAVSQVQWLYCNTTLLVSLTWSQYTRVYCDTICPHPPACCNTLLITIQQLYCNTIPIAFSLLQYIPVYCNTLPLPTSLLLQYNNCIAVKSPSLLTASPPLLQYNSILAIQIFFFLTV